MTMNVALGIAAPSPSGRNADRTGPAKADETRFDEALAGNSSRRRPQDSAKDEPMETHPSWKADGPRRDYAAADRAETEGRDTDNAFAAFLEKLAAAEMEDGQNGLPPGEDETVAEASPEGDPMLALFQTAAPDEQGENPQAGIDERKGDKSGGNPLNNRTQNAAETGPLVMNSGRNGDGNPGNGREEGQSGRSQPAPAPSSPAGAAAAPAAQIEEPVAEARPQRAEAAPARMASVMSEPAAARTPTSTNIAGPVSAFGGRVDVLGFSATPAPVATPLSNPTISGLVTAMEAEPTWRSATVDPSLPAASRSQTPQSGFSTLRIQLNPAELGMVTARLTANGSQLSVEIQVESNDARQRLTSDSDAIVKALRGAGFDVEKVTIQQASQNTSSNGQQSASGGRDFGQADQQARHGADANGRGQQQETSRDRKAGGHAQGEPFAGHSGGGLYI